MTLRLILIFTFIWTISCSGQTADKDIVGEWTFAKLTVTKKGKTLDSLTSEIKSTFLFSADGTYTETNINPDKSKTTDTGKWKLIEGGKKVHLFNIKTTAPNSIISDHDWKIVKDKTTLFLTYTYGDSIFAPETMFYKKVK
jgi:hypothetical protein